MEAHQSEEGLLRAALRGDDERVLPLELFFDLVFVLAITQCTAVMAHDQTWAGLGKGMLLLGIVWWTWVGYAWLTSVVDPEEGVVRVVIIGAMAGLIVVALCLPQAIGDDGLLFACGITAVRGAHIALFVLASRDDPRLRSSVLALGGSTAIACAILIAGSFAGGWQAWIWLFALLLDAAGPKFFGIDGWRIVPGHYAERHGLIVLIALGESIVEIAAGSRDSVTTGVVVAAIVSVVLSAELWWLYFDVVALVAARRLFNARPGREQNAIARDSFTYLHEPMVAGIVLVALGVEETIAGVHEHLHRITAVALLGGVALYLLAHVAFRWRNVHRFSEARLAVAALCLAAIPLAERVAALATLIGLTVVLLLLVLHERRRFAELRHRLRHPALPVEA